MLRCLIVDDNPRFLDAASGLLEREGVAVVGTASTSAEAAQRVVELRPDLALVDIDLGGESGFDVARQLHGKGRESLPKIILISTHAEQDYADLIAAGPPSDSWPRPPCRPAPSGACSMATLRTTLSSRAVTYSPRAGPTSAWLVFESRRWLRHQHTEEWAAAAWPPSR